MNGSESVSHAVIVAEMTLGELDSPSGIEDLTNLQAVRFLEEAIHGAHDVILSMNGHLTTESSKANSAVTRAAQERGKRTGNSTDYTYAVVSLRPSH